jgi:phospholipid/cholesterol/gamma-HCH transport system substrate-binding protein
MKKTFWTETKVGLFVIVGAIILAVGISLVGKFRWGKPKGYAVTATFGSISGLEEKSPVRISGVRVGEVEKIYLKDGLAYVQMRVSPEAVIREDSQVAVSSLGLLGEKYVEISSGSTDRPKVPEGSVVRGKDVAGMDKLIEQFTEVAADIKAVTGSLRTFLGPEEGKSGLGELVRHFDQMVADIDALVADNREGIKGAVSSVSRLAGRADKLVADNQDDLRASIKNFRELTETLQAQVKSLSDKLGGAVDKVSSSVTGAKDDFSSTLAEVKKTAATIEATVASLKEIVDKTRRGEGTIGKLFYDDATYRSLNTSLDNISSLSQKLSKGEGTLGKLLTDDSAYKSFDGALKSINTFLTKGDQIKLYVGFKSEYLFDPRDTRSTFSLRINPREDKFYLVEAVDNPRGKLTITDTTNTVVNDGGVPVTITQHEEKYENKLTFNLLFGWRFDDLVVRAGLMESTGGAGVDWYLFGNRARLTLEAYDFNRKDANPHLKAAAFYNLYKEFYLTAGVDDFVEKDNLSLFAGAGLFFSDDDIKNLLGFASYLK